MSYASSITSTNSSTLSAFVRRRLIGEVPIFGGDVRVGVAELGGAVVNSAHTQLTRTLQNITGSLARLESKAKTLEAPPSMSVHYEDVERPHQLLRVSREHQAVATVDMERVETLLTESVIERDDLDTYVVFLRTLDKTTKQSPVLKVTPKINDIKSSVSDDQVRVLAETKDVHIESLCSDLDMSSENAKIYLQRALIHTSALGLQVNVSLASLGNSAVTQHIRGTAMKRGQTVAEATSMLQRLASKDEMCNKGLTYGLHSSVITGPNVRTEARNVLGTVMFAVAGACYYIHGEKGIAKYMEVFKIYCD